MPRAPLPKGNALIRKTSRRHGMSSKGKGNALIKEISSMRRRLVNVNAPPRPTDLGRSRDDPIELAESEDDDAQGSGPTTAITRSPRMRAVVKRQKMEESDQDIVVLGEYFKSEPANANAPPPPTMTRQAFRPNPLAMTAGKADEPIELLDSDSDDLTAAAVPAVSRPGPSNPNNPPKQDMTAHNSNRTISGSDRKRKARELRKRSPTPSDTSSDGYIIPSSDEEDDIKMRGRRPRDAESSRQRKRPRRHLPSISISPVDPRESSSPRVAPVYRGSVVSGESDASDLSASDAEPWEDFHSGFPHISLDAMQAAEREPTTQDAERARKAERDARAADQDAALKDTLRRKHIGVIMEPVRPPRPVQAVFLDHRGQNIPSPDFPWNFTDILPLLSVRRIPNIITDRSSVRSLCERELVHRGHRRALGIVKQLVGTSGAIWATDQSRNGTIAIAASVVDGEERWRSHRTRYDLNPYNKAGNLSIWRRKDNEEEDAPTGDTTQLDEVKLLHGHLFRDVFDAGIGANRTHYSSVLSVAFDPFTEDTFISSSSDGSVRKWERRDDQALHINTHTWTYDKHPHHLMYHTKQRIFAVGSMDGHVHVHRSDEHATQSSIEGDEPDRQISSMKWGKGSTSHLLFFATEHPGENRNDGEAYAADYSSGSTKALYRFPGIPGGDAVMALDDTGSNLAIVAGLRDNKARQSLLIYQPHLSAAEKLLECRLPEFGYIAHPTSLSDACHVMDVQFSPCGTYIAIARDNNCALVYDIRNATTPMHVFGHVTYSRDDMETRFAMRGGDKASYGIANLGWMGSNTLVTGGADGCVRRWNIGVATRNMGGKAIARLDQPVAHLSFADESLAHRYPLIAGDMEGKVYVFDYSVGDNGGSLL